MIFKLQYRLKSDLIDVETKEIQSEDYNDLLDFIKLNLQTGYEWNILVDKNVYKNGYIPNPKKEDLIENHGCFTLSESATERSELTAKMEASVPYKKMGIDKIRIDYLIAYDKKELLPTVKK